MEKVEDSGSRRRVALAASLGELREEHTEEKHRRYGREGEAENQEDPRAPTGSR